MNVNGKLTVIAALIATFGASSQAQTRPESYDRAPKYRVSPYLVFDTAGTNTVRADGAIVQNGAPAPTSLNNGTGQFARAPNQAPPGSLRRTWTQMAIQISRSPAATDSNASSCSMMARAGSYHAP